MPKNFPIEALRRLLDYIEPEEARHYEESEEEDKKEHIYHAIAQLSVWEYADRKGF